MVHGHQDIFLLDSYGIPIGKLGLLGLILDSNQTPIGKLGLLGLL
jgi:hypothetical protein